jgi:hypothetical protein
MNAIRIAISLFIVVLIVAAVSGWVWTGDHQAPAQSMASRVVLTISALAGAVGLVMIWRR